MQHCVLQVFVANPHKPPAIVDILVNNRNKLLKYLEDFHTDRGESGGGLSCDSLRWSTNRQGQC